MSVASVKAELMKMPDLPQLMGELASALEQERLKRQVFYEWVDENKKVEFINGEIIEHSPVADEHSEIFNFASRAIGTYVDFNNLGKMRGEKAMVSLTRNDYEPDICFWRKEISDNFDNSQTHYPAPDWICEILSKGTKLRDKGVKFRDYAAHGVKEYWIIDPRRKTIEQFVLPKNSNEYELFKKLGIGDMIESISIHGFKIMVESLFDKEKNNDAMRNLILSSLKK